jgi:catalase
MSSVLYDALIVADVPPDGDAPTSGDPVHWAAEAYKHGKAVGALGSGTELLRRAGLPGIQISSDGQGVVEELGVVTLASPDVSADGAGNVGEFAETFAQAAGGLRRFERSVDSVPA